MADKQYDDGYEGPSSGFGATISRSEWCPEQTFYYVTVKDGSGNVIVQRQAVQSYTLSHHGVGSDYDMEIVLVEDA